MIIEKAGTRITSLDDWHRLAPPKSADGHWVDHRSAKEAARAWLQHLPAPPPEVHELLLSHPHLAGVTVERAEPEALLRFDDAAGPRNADLALWASDARGSVGITVEAKADESFDLLVAETFSKALERSIERPASGGVTRILHLANALFRTKQSRQVRVGDLRYQLLTATAGTLAHAAMLGASRAVLVVHEFVTVETSARKLVANHDDLSAFLARISGGAFRELVSGVMYGPVEVPGSPLFGTPPALYIGKAVRRLGAPRE